MIKKSLLFAVAAVALYAVYVAYGNPKPVAQHLWQSNIIRTQRYLYTDSLRKCDLVLGTSLTDKVVNDSLPPNVYMLTFPGLSVWDGIAIMKRGNIFPKYVFIEQNAVIKPPSEQFDNYIFDHINYSSKEYLPVLRDCYQPVGQVAGLTQRVSTKGVKAVSDYMFNPVLRLLQGDTVKTLDQSVYYAMERKRRSTVDTAMLKKSFIDLQKEVDWFAKRGTKIYFFETPIHKEVFMDKQRTAIYQGFMQYLPPGKYHYLPAVNIADYQTIRDQVHLNSESAKHYSQVLARQIAEARQGKY